MELIKAIKEILINELNGMSKEEVEYYFANPSEYSCINGCVSAFIYYKDTETFARDYHNEIIDLMNEYGVNNLTLNNMAWFAYEALVPVLENEVIDELFPSTEMEVSND